MRELAGLAATLDVTPVRRRRHRRDVDRFDDLAGAQRAFERADDEILHRDRACAARLRSVNFAPSAESADTQSAAGSAWLSDPPIVPRLRTAR